jgi:hypothetical protein
MVAGVPSWLLLLFQALLEQTGKATIAEVWPKLEVVGHGGVKFDPYRQAFARVVGSPAIRFLDIYACSEGFVGFGDPERDMLRLVFNHDIFYEFVPLEELGTAQPRRHWLGNLVPGVNYAIVLSTCAGMWAHLVGDTVRFESIRPPLFTFTGRTKYSLSAFGEHLINEEVELAVAAASASTGASVRDWHLGPEFQGALGHHVFVFEFLEAPRELESFRKILDTELCTRNADYQAHRSDGVGLPLPGLIVARPGALDSWLRARGQHGGQHKMPRMDGTGKLTGELAAFLRSENAVERELPPGGGV